MQDQNTQPYNDFLRSKVLTAHDHGFDIDPTKLNPMLFDWQRAIVKWAIKKGQAALFEECGLGKTPQQLEWAHQVCLYTGGNVLILTPLAVAPQTQREALKFGIELKPEYFDVACRFLAEEEHALTSQMTLEMGAVS